MYTEKISSHLFEFKPPLTKEADFKSFWDHTIALSKNQPLNVKVEPYPYPSPYVKVYSITYDGFLNTPIHGWFLVPAFSERKTWPCLIHYHGRGGNRGKPAGFMSWIMLGVAVVSIDIRDQSGLTCDQATYNSSYQGNPTLRGILDPEEYYFRSIYMDAMRAIDFACSREEVDSDQIILDGGSQGGGIVSALSALDSRPFLAMTDVPSNSLIHKRVVNGNGAFGAVQEFLANNPGLEDRVFQVLSYFDTMNMADQIQCKTLASVGLKDTVCPAEHYFATYNRILSEKEIYIYPFDQHRVNPNHHEIKLNYVARHIK